MATVGIALATADALADPSTSVEGCLSKSKAAQIIDASSAPVWVKNVDKPSAPPGFPKLGGIQRIICADVTQDGRADATVVEASGGSAGIGPWLVIQARPVGWRVIFWRNELAGGLKVRNGRISNEWTDYEPTDIHCCPTGAIEHRTYGWNGHRIVLLKMWKS
jgi:hypothetical protein